ncbi:hypothetical protein LOTGIDRAFT_233913 [Lottia gigantea]|uniref:Uncharacterized protein n=1 Tax=Lottia gigantea TaxID=225164 RepID=V3ZFX6_LOTGI|nr:hypothetical protein LOTGIDRAFT_233913 [Lottia gigantea]ESO90103.1 hypothetical protein LOTGIDRAFT_233913 [Lottia gigantea]
MSLTSETGYSYNISDLKCQVYFPGLSYDDFDRNGCISAWKISKLFEGGRAIAFLGGFTSDLLSPKTRTRFIVAQNIQLVPNTTKRYRSFPFSVMLELKDVGLSSVTIEQVLRNEKNDKIIGTSVFKFVCVDRETKRPASLLKEARERYLKLLGGSAKAKPQFLMTIPDLPLDTYHIPIFVLPNDTDQNQHLNQGQFVRYCLDCAAMASIEGYYQYFITDICNYQATDIDVLYKREALAGDLVHAHTWQDKNDPQILYFIITKDKNSLLHARIRFALEPISKSKL